MTRQITNTLDGSNCDDGGGGAREELTSSIKAIECAYEHVREKVRDVVLFCACHSVHTCMCANKHNDTHARTHTHISHLRWTRSAGVGDGRLEMTERKKGVVAEWAGQGGVGGGRGGREREFLLCSAT